MDGKGGRREGRGVSRGTWALLIALVLAIGANLVIFHSIFDKASGASRTTAEPATEAAPAEKDKAPAVSDRIEAGDEDAPGQGSATATDDSYDPSADPRSADFAVDPDRTDWNFDASDVRTVYLTFDDGPSENTAAVLDILDRYDIKATFFVTNINPEYQDMIAECYRRGHTIGMHTYSHDYAQVYASVEAYWEDLRQISEIVEEQIGYVPCFIRFPGGSSNTVSANYTYGIMSELSQEVVAAGYQYYDWDASSGDGATHTADELVEATKADTSYDYDSIVFLSHDGAGKETTVEALPRIIEYFQSEGYVFAPIDRQSRVVHHGIGN